MMDFGLFSWDLRFHKLIVSVTFRSLKKAMAMTNEVEMPELPWLMVEGGRDWACQNFCILSMSLLDIYYLFIYFYVGHKHPELRDIVCLFSTVSPTL